MSSDVVIESNVAEAKRKRKKKKKKTHDTLYDETKTKLLASSSEPRI